MSVLVRTTHKRVSRAGRPIRSQVRMQQLLYAGKAKGRFIAILCDRETGTRVKEILLWEPNQEESLDLRIEWEDAVEEESDASEDD